MLVSQRVGGRGGGVETVSQAQTARVETRFRMHLVLRTTGGGSWGAGRRERTRCSWLWIGVRAPPDDGANLGRGDRRDLEGWARATGAGVGRERSDLHAPESTEDRYAWVG